MPNSLKKRTASHAAEFGTEEAAAPGDDADADAALAARGAAEGAEGAELAAATAEAALAAGLDAAAASPSAWGADTDRFKPASAKLAMISSVAAPNRVAVPPSSQLLQPHVAHGVDEAELCAKLIVPQRLVKQALDHFRVSGDRHRSAPSRPNTLASMSAAGR